MSPTDLPAPPPTLQGVALLLWSVDPDRPELLATPFFHAAAAAAMDAQVELYFAARSVHLLVPGVAAGLRASTRHTKTIEQAMLDAVQHGARLYACTDALDAQGIPRDGLIAQCSGHGGAVQFMARALDPAWRTMVF